MPFSVSLFCQVMQKHELGEMSKYTSFRLPNFGVIIVQK